MSKFKVIISSADILQALCKSENKWGMHISISSYPDCLTSREADEEMLKTVPYLVGEDQVEYLDARYAFLLFDSEIEMLNHYEQTVGDDGPNESNTYSGKARTYALTCNPTGQLENENT